MPGIIPDNEMINKKFGRWTVLQRAETPSGKRKKWICQCDCGTIREVEGTTLRTGRSQSCGCIAKEKHTRDLQGQQFGELTVLEKTNQRKDGSVVWHCQCSCGKQCDVDAHSLQRGSTKSCGHLIGKNFMEGAKDISNQRFGRLVALSPTEERKYRSVVWKCQCDCGKYLNVSLHQLQEGKVKSCGCLKTSYGEFKIAELLTAANIPYTREQKFSTLGQYRFDFYVNNKYLIEFDGKQHFVAENSGWFTDDVVSETQKRDSIKNQWCKENNIPLIRIPYYELDTVILKDLLLETTRFRVV